MCTGLKERGNSYLAPVFGNPALHVLHQLRAQSRLYRLLLQSEAARASRCASTAARLRARAVSPLQPKTCPHSHPRAVHRYASVVWSRLDFFWLRPHPPLRLLSSCALWVPLAEDSGVLNDRHAMMAVRGPID